MHHGHPVQQGEAEGDSDHLITVKVFIQSTSRSATCQTDKVLLE